jgi:hypothetical protein
MGGFDLLDSVQPSAGWFAICGIKDGRVRQELLATREEVDELVPRLMQGGYDVFFGVAKFDTDASRKKDNVRALKAFWLDIDCGPDKAIPNPKTGIAAGYETQTNALEALKDFCGTYNLPRPVLVSSGRGLHVYWVLDEEVTRAQWEPTAVALQAACVKQGLLVDPSVFEVSRILRVPDTFNYKTDPPIPVDVLTTGGGNVEFEEFAALLGVDTTAAPPPVTGRRRAPSALAQSLEEGNSQQCSFARIIEQTEYGTGCLQLQFAVDNSASIGYDLWTAALSIANKCQIDRDDGIRIVSEGHPDYNFEAASAKAASFKGPRTCADIERTSPGGCTGCHNKGKITSPITLGVVVPEGKPVVMLHTSADAAEVAYKPQYYPPYYWAETGGIFRRPTTPEGNPEPVYPHHLYVVRRLNDPELGDVIQMRLHLPRDETRSFIVTAAQATDVSELRKLLASWGVMCNKKRFDMIIDHVQSSISRIQYTFKADHMRTQFGWASNNSAFILGDREVTAGGVFHSPPSKATASIAEFMIAAGTMEKWQEVFNLYNLPGHEPHAFAALTAFGAPLLRFTGQRGAMINVIHPRSGTGKTTILQMCNSVWGDPVRLSATKQDTANTKMHKLGVMNNISYTVDEITNTTAEEFSELIYGMTNGRGKDRMMAASNEMRHNTTTWQTIALCSSNASFYERLATHKSIADGESMRLLEYRIDYANVLEPDYAKSMFDQQLLKNYGHAGLVYVKYLISNSVEVERLLLSTQTKIDRELKLTQRERIWSATVAANMTGGLIAKRAGLIDWDLTRIYDWVMLMVAGMRQEVTPPVDYAVSVLSDFVNAHVPNILVTNHAADQRSKVATRPLIEPTHGKLIIRYEPDTKQMFITVTEFRDFCAKQQINYRDTLKELGRTGIYLGQELKRISKGMKVSVPGGTQCLKFDCSSPDFIDIDGYVKEAAGDDGGRG